MNLKEGIRSLDFLDSPKYHWQSYKNLFQITIFKYLITWFAIVPLVGTLLNRIPGAVRVEVLNKAIEYTINLSLPFNWRVLWYSSFCFVIAFALYHIFCPHFIKTYNSYNDYKNLRHSPRWIIREALYVVEKNIELAKFFERLKTKKYISKINSDIFNKKMAAIEEKRKVGANKSNNSGVLVEEKQSTLIFKYNGKSYSLGMPCIDDNSEIDLDQTEMVEKDLFWEIFGRFSASHSLIRLIILTLLLISGVLFLIVLVQNIIAAMSM